MNQVMQVLFVMVTLGLPIVTIVTLAYAFATRGKKPEPRKAFVERARPAQHVTDAASRA